ncbi:MULTISPECIES: hypothetical protein [unclassified Aureimonas]|uniref:hypothetical protein n=1 Tax=unclassified Aureimonas TaxID=2615206 RepID=UPI000AD8FB0E|nr:MULTISPECIES: hypothetical protein [unclassified Aureimonas]
MKQSVYFVHLIPTGGKYTDDANCIFEFCISNSLIGVGWAVGDDFKTTSDFAAYESQYPKFHSASLDSSIRTIRDMKKGDLVWTRDADRQFYLSEVRGKWFYRNSALGRAFDIVNVRKVETWKIDNSNLPVELSRTAYRKAAQEIHDESIIAHTKTMWSHLYTEEALTS